MEKALTMPAKNMSSVTTKASVPKTVFGKRGGGRGSRITRSGAAACNPATALVLPRVHRLGDGGLGPV